MDYSGTGKGGRARGQHARTAVMSVMIVLAMFVGMGFDRLLMETGIAQSSVSSLAEFQTVEETYGLIRDNYVLQSEVTDQELMWGAARGMMDALGDTGHSVFLTPDEAYSYNAALKGGLVGIGVTVDTTGDLPVIVAPMKDSPALKAGILPGDTIVAINGTSLEGMDPGEGVDMIRGEAGTDVTLRLIHKGETEPYEVTITRQEIPLDPVSWAMLPGGVMWLQFDQFSRGSANQMRAALEEAKAQGMTSIILDLRGNGGGYTDETRAIASMFLPANTPIYEETDKDGNVTTYTTDPEDGAYLNEPMVVLIDGRSASASEVLSSGLRNNDRVELIGETTVGVGTVIVPFELSDGSMVVVGIRLLLTSTGESFFQKGIEPTREVPLGEGQQQSLLVIEDPTGTMSLSEEQFQAIEDNQLHAAYDAVIVPVAVATP